MIIDTHAHYDYARFDKNRTELLEHVFSGGIAAVVNPAIEFGTNQTMREKLADYPGIYYAAGIHPGRLPTDLAQDEQFLAQLYCWAGEKRTVAIGETGLDYHHSTVGPERQALWFRRQIKLAYDSGLPLILHIRDAASDALAILKDSDFGPKPGVVHCFYGDEKTAREYLELGFVLGIGGVLTYDYMTAFQDAVKHLPLEKMVLETDAPFLRPQGWEEGPNSSLALPLVVQKIAELKGILPEEVMDTTCRTARTLFHI